MLDENDDLLIDENTGDFVIGDSTYQNIACIFKTAQGNWKNAPLMGLNPHNQYNDDGVSTRLIQDIKFQVVTLEKATINKLSVNDGQIDIEVKY